MFGLESSIRSVRRAPPPERACWRPAACWGERGH
jgi:hypothetical protein